MLANFYGGVTAGDTILWEGNNEIKAGAKEADLDGTSVAHPIGSRSDGAIKTGRGSPDARGFKRNTISASQPPWLTTSLRPSLANTMRRQAAAGSTSLAHRADQQQSASQGYPGVGGPWMENEKQRSRP